MKLKHLFLLPALLTLSFCGKSVDQKTDKPAAPAGSSVKPDTTGLGETPAKDSADWVAVDMGKIDLGNDLNGESIVTHSVGNAPSQTYAVNSLVITQFPSIKVMPFDGSEAYFDGKMTYSKNLFKNEHIIRFDGKQLILTSVAKRGNVTAWGFEVYTTSDMSTGYYDGYIRIVQ